jgi:hypothetical protein
VPVPKNGLHLQSLSERAELFFWWDGFSAVELMQVAWLLGKKARKLPSRISDGEERD